MQVRYVGLTGEKVCVNDIFCIHVPYGWGYALNPEAKGEEAVFTLVRSKQNPEETAEGYVADSDIEKEANGVFAFYDYAAANSDGASVIRSAMENGMDSEMAKAYDGVKMFGLFDDPTESKGGYRVLRDEDDLKVGFLTYSMLGTVTYHISVITGEQYYAVTKAVFSEGEFEENREAISRVLAGIQLAGQQTVQTSQTDETTEAESPEATENQETADTQETDENQETADTQGATENQDATDTQDAADSPAPDSGVGEETAPKTDIPERAETVPTDRGESMDAAQIQGMFDAFESRENRETPKSYESAAIEQDSNLQSVEEQFNSIDVEPIESDGEILPNLFEPDLTEQKSQVTQESNPEVAVTETETDHETVPVIVPNADAAEPAESTDSDTKQDSQSAETTDDETAPDTEQETLNEAAQTEEEPELTEETLEDMIAAILTTNPAEREAACMQTIQKCEADIAELETRYNEVKKKSESLGAAWIRELGEKIRLAESEKDSAFANMNYMQNQIEKANVFQNGMKKELTAKVEAVRTDMPRLTKNIRKLEEERYEAVNRPKATLSDIQDQIDYAKWMIVLKQEELQAIRQEAGASQTE